MLDFLSNLALSASPTSAPMRVADVVLPRLASRFEPTGGPVGLAPWVLEARGDDVRGPEARQAPPESAREHEPEREPAQLFDVRVDGRHADPIEDHEGDVLSRLTEMEQQLRKWHVPQSQSQGIQHSMRETGVSVAVQPHSAKRSVDQRHDAISHPAPPPIDGHDDEATRGTSQTPVATTGHGLPPNTRDTLQDSGHVQPIQFITSKPVLIPVETNADLPRTVTSGQPTARPTSTMQPSVRPRPIEAETRVRPQPRPPTREAKPAAPVAVPTPTIHVSIGRVEVRATAQPTSAARRVVAEPEKSPLDAYLNRRGNSNNGGAR